MLYLVALAFVMSVGVMGAIVICWLDFKRAIDRECYCSVCRKGRK
jgi:hypothetical protein